MVLCFAVPSWRYLDVDVGNRSLQVHGGCANPQSRALWLWERVRVLEANRPPLHILLDAQLDHVHLPNWLRHDDSNNWQRKSSGQRLKNPDSCAWSGLRSITIQLGGGPSGQSTRPHKPPGDPLAL